MVTRLRFVMAGAMVIVGAGCTVHAQTEPVGYAEVTSTPVEIERSPHTRYDGREVYLYHDRWYYRDGGNWRYYQNEPQELVRERPHVQEAPPAQRSYPSQPYPQRGYEAPPPAPAPGYVSPASAPPAVRVQ